MSALSGEERRDRLRLIRTDSVGPITYRQLLARFGTARAAIKALPDLARRGGRRAALRVCSIEAAEAEIAAIAAAGATWLVHGETRYPARLAAIEDAPPVIIVRGNAELLARPIVSIVGSRFASANGAAFARRLAKELGEAEWIVASGLARGIDTAAHQGSLTTGTIAVLAGGIDVIYPIENTDLHHAIADKGCLVAEMPPGFQPRGQHFPRRNRVIAGLALGLVVVEAAIESGSLITARQAAEQGREVFAVPGSPLDPRARGTNDLIRHGATLCESAADVLRVLTPLSMREPANRSPPPTLPEPTPEEVDRGRAIVLALLGPSPVPVDEIIRQCQLSPPVVWAALLEAELAGRLTRHPGNLVSLLE